MFDPSKLIQATRLSRIAKATVQRTGRLGFSQGAAKMLELGDNKTVLLFSGDGRNLFLVVVDGPDDRGFQVRKIGEYFYIPTKVYYDQSGIDYVSNVVDYEITELPDQFESRPVFNLRYRDHVRGSKGIDEVEEPTAAEESPTPPNNP